MKKQLLLLCLAASLSTTSYAQWSAGALVGVGRTFQQQTSQSADYVSVLGVKPVQPLKMAGVYGQFMRQGKWPLLTGLQLRYQHYVHPRGVYDYLVLTPYVGTRLFGKVEVAVGPELTTLLHVGQNTPPFRYSTATKLMAGYNVKATYWLGRFGVEGGYSQQFTAFMREEVPAIGASFAFYNNYAYGALKYRLFESH